MKKIKDLASLDRLEASQRRLIRAADRILGIVHSRSHQAGDVIPVSEDRRRR